MKLDDSFLMDIKMRNDIASVISSHVTLKKRGSNLVGLCPFHNEKTGSFTVYPQNGSFYCFGCGVGGDVITFQMKVENIDYIEAVRMLADRCGLQMPEEGYDDSMHKLRMKIYEINRETARFFHSQLVSKSGEQALKYLTDRQLSMGTIRRFGLGFAPDSWDSLYRHLRGLGYSDDLLVQADLVMKRRNGNGCFDRFRKRVMYPIIDLRGNVIAFGGRILPGEESPAKYINTSDTPVYKKSHNIYAMNIAKNSKADKLILCEGYMDVIAMHQAGFDNAVAACGTAFTEEQAKLLSRYTNEIIITMDADAAGEKSTNRTIDILTRTGVSIRVLRLPDAKDPDEFIKKFGPERFKGLIEGAGNDIEYKLQVAKTKYDVDTDNGRLSYLREAAAILAGVDDSIARALYAGKLSQDYNIPLDSLNREIGYIAGQKHRVDKKKTIAKAVRKPEGADRINPDRNAHLGAAIAEETILHIYIMHPSLFDRVPMSEEDFITAFNRRVFARLSELLTNGMTPDVSLFSSCFSPDEMGRIVEIMNRNVGGDVAEDELKDCIRRLSSEKNRLTAFNPSEMNEDDWAMKIKEISQNKRGDKK